MILFIAVNVLIIALLAGAVVEYFRLKHFMPNDAGKDRCSSFRIIDVMFNPELRGQPRARRIQKRAIWLFCTALVLVHVSKELYAQLK